MRPVWSLARARAVLPPQQPLLLRSRCLCSDPSRADARAFAGIFVCRLTLHVCGVDRETAWTALNLSHAGFSFYYVHWLKGMPMFRCARAAQALRAALAADRLNCARALPAALTAASRPRLQLTRMPLRRAVWWSRRAGARQTTTRSTTG